MFKTLCLTATVALAHAIESKPRFEPTIDVKELAQISTQAANEAALALLDQMEEAADNASQAAAAELSKATAGADDVTAAAVAVGPGISHEASPEIEEILKMLDINNNGKVSWTEMITAVNALASMLNFKISATGKGELKYMWTLVDTDFDNEITTSEVEAILKKAPIIDKLNAWASKVLKVGQQ